MNRPPDKDNAAAADSDFYTLVGWEAEKINPALRSIALPAGSGVEAHTILRSNNPALTRPTSGAFLATRPGIGLHAWGALVG